MAAESIPIVRLALTPALRDQCGCSGQQATQEPDESSPAACEMDYGNIHVVDTLHDRRNALCPTRRAFLQRMAAALPAAFLLSPVGKAMAGAHTRSLRFRHLHTGEKLSVVYYADESYLPDALAAINHLLRDFRTDDEHAIDRNLLDLLYDISLKIGRSTWFEVISGYRSPSTNVMLRQTSKKVARQSLHMQGRAIDVRVRGLDAALLRSAATSMKRGGVGYYPNSAFVHLDTGRFRTW